jgi:hypothetical protein
VSGRPEGHSGQVLLVYVRRWFCID